MTTPQHPSTDQGGARAAEAPRAKQSRSGLGRHRPWVGARIPVWLPLLIATVSFATSTYTFFATNAAPDLALTMPVFVRVAQGPNLGNVAVAYLQPSFTNTGQSARVEVISGMTLRVQPASGGEAATFTWQEIGRFVPDTTTGGLFRLNYEYVSDAQPLLVSQGSPQTPVATLIDPAGWYFTPGAYKITLIANRQVNTAPLQRTIQITLTDASIAALNEQGGGTFLREDATQVK
ncbi:MAG TPA: hypothetical protein VHR15_08680 [Ktedonobacterales bacterium]|jgi:hypothetical protein|nr:hypothetical protein [Ktedonobacterales bacterium]